MTASQVTLLCVMVIGVICTWWYKYETSNKVYDYRKSGPKKVDFFTMGILVGAVIYIEKDLRSKSYVDAWMLAFVVLIWSICAVWYYYRTHRRPSGQQDLQSYRRELSDDNAN